MLASGKQNRMASLAMAIFALALWVVPNALAQEPAEPPAPAPAEAPVEADAPAEAPAEGADFGDAEGDSGLGEADIEREMNAAQAIADTQRKRRTRESAFSRSRIQNMENYEFEVEGATEAEAMTDATVRALTNAASRLYFEDYILIGRDVLQPYLRVYGDRFLARRTILEKRILADGRVHLRVRMGVDLDRFYDDLRKKRFIAKPEVRPIMGVILEEIVDGQTSADGRGRRILEDSMRAREMRVETRRLLPHALNVDVSEGEAKSTARDEAQRGGVEVIVTGRLIVQQDRDRQNSILYDTFYFYTAEVWLTMIRVDTGEVLGTTHERFSASAADDPNTPDNEGPTAAMDKTFEELMPRAIESLGANFLKVWQQTMLDNGDYRLLITGVDPADLENIFNVLHTFNPQIKTFTKAHFGDVAVVNVFLPENRPGELEGFLKKTRVMQFQVRSDGAKRIELHLL